MSDPFNLNGQAVAAQLVEVTRERDALKAQLKELNDAITWGTTCLNCSYLLSISYSEYVRADEAGRRIARANSLIRVWGSDPQQWPEHAPSTLTEILERKS